MKNDKPEKNFEYKLEAHLKKDARFVDKGGNLIKNVVVDKAGKSDSALIELLFCVDVFRTKFFQQIGQSKESWVFNVALFVDFVTDKHFLEDSYTKFKTHIGLTLNGKPLSQRREVALIWPFKDCVLEGGMSDEKNGRKEIFFNEILAQDEIDRLLHPKVLTKGRRFSRGDERSVGKLTRDDSGIIRENLIIKGNNLLVLHSLKKQFADKIKLIYIDPPYNTGSDSFKYNDNFNHSAWLTFMKNRLEVARELLCNDGIIFVQCDDNEQSYLKVLMDEVFGQDNFEGNITWRRRHNQPNDKSKMIAVVAEYILVYAKNSQILKSKESFYTLPLSEKRKEDYKNPDNDSRGIWDTTPWKSATNQGGSEYEIVTPSGKRLVAQWLGTKETFENLLKDKRIVFPNGSKGFPRKKIFWAERVEQGQPAHNFWTHNEFGSNQEGSAELDALFGKGMFENPKPEKLLQRIMEIATQPGDIVLDYHLGSGTTAAVAHKMGRQYIGVEQMDYIETIAVERLKKVITGEQGGISKTVNWQGGNKFVYLELKRYNQEFIDRIQNTKTTKALEKIRKEMEDKSSLNWDVDLRRKDLAFEEWQKMPFPEQQKALVCLLNKNQLYVSMSEINDEEFGCSDDEKALSKEFYKRRLNR